MAFEYDAVIVGSGPNGLSAAVTLAREGRKVLVLEKYRKPGGGVRTDVGPLPGFHHDVCSAVFPMAVCSPFFQSLDLARYGLEWIQPDIPLAHPFDDGTAVAMHQSIGDTADQFDSVNANAYRRLFEPLLNDSDDLFRDLLRVPDLPSNLFAAARFGMKVLPSALEIARSRFSDEKARSLFIGNAAHSVLPLDRPVATGAVGLMLMLAGHKAGWPFARGGAESISRALCECLIHHGGEIVCDQNITSFDQLPTAKAWLFDTGPHALATIADGQLPERYIKRLNRYRYGPGVFKIDYALSEPVPWSASECRKAGTVHLGGTMQEIAESENDATIGKYSEKPFVLTAQPSLFDSSRAPEGKHTFWAYCHVPSGSTVDMTPAIENQIERFAPGFRDTILERLKRTTEDYSAYNPNLVGGDVIGGVTDWRQLVTRPVASMKPHTTPNKRIFICSASTPPGAGVHGMCGNLAARQALKITS